MQTININYDFLKNQDNIPECVSLIVQQNQVRKEIQLGINSIFWMSFPTVALFFWEVRGYSKLYDNISESSLGGFVFTAIIVKLKKYFQKTQFLVSISCFGWVYIYFFIVLIRPYADRFRVVWGLPEHCWFSLLY